MNAAGGTRKRNEDGKMGETLVLAARLRHHHDYLSWSFGFYISLGITDCYLAVILCTL